LPLADEQCKIEAERKHYNETRPRSALGWLTPQEFSIQAQKKTESMVRL
jgi:putative transposase